MGTTPQGVLGFFRLGWSPGFTMGTLGFAGGGGVVIEWAVFSAGFSSGQGCL